MPLSASHGGSSLTSRRTATNNLPGPLELPTNPLITKFGGPLSSSGLPTVGNGQQSQSNISALLTPPSHIPGESLSPLSSGSNSSSNPAAIGLPPYTPTGYWSQHNGGSGSTPQPQPTTLAQSWNSSATAYNGSRGRFSPSLTSIMKNGQAGSPSEQLPPPSYDLGALPPFPNSLNQHGTMSPAQHQQGMNFSIPSNSTSMSMPSHTSPVHAPDPYLQKLPPTPSYYSSGPNMNSQQSHYHQYHAQSPPVQSPLSMPNSNRISPVNQPIQQFARPPYNHHGLPGPVMSNLHSPTGQMQMGGQGGMVPLFNSGTAAHHAQQIQHMYTQPGQQPIDRPFKCDQCPQSFNRNHDLKRHKRIHLAVKPFPCGHCDKSFSRKDALKRHILVKGCGKTSADAKSSSPDGRDLSSGEDSPIRSN
ncbi:hypothetical protein MMC10_006169 [Thelotrema lepadinum]|nr:hypothetical protein [Thelotrema lepadinum]